ncbi:DUF397 domain-containing protein [Actinomadura sp. NTSP31]|uniref:DUF397 domain-containing protein n=1 Tax=Actinomadura sp. NTSP31 TaxID=1735447 RepID=UPI0035C086D5
MNSLERRIGPRQRPHSEWRKSSYSGGESCCVELRLLPTGTIFVRDSKAPDGDRLALTIDECRAFLNAAKGGRRAPVA